MMVFRVSLSLHSNTSLEI